MLSEYDLVVIGGGGAKRLHIPMGDKFVWRTVADQLRGLATTLDHYSRLPVTEDLNERTMHVIVMGQIDAFNRIVRKEAVQAGLVIADGRKRTNKTKERRADNARTDETVCDRQTQVVEFQGLKR